MIKIHHQDGDNEDIIKEAIALKKETSRKILLAIQSLQEAQNFITDVEGKGSSDIYSEIADHYSKLRELKNRVDNLEPTGVFQM